MNFFDMYENVKSKESVVTTQKDPKTKVTLNEPEVETENEPEVETENETENESEE